MLQDEGLVILQRPACNAPCPQQEEEADSARYDSTAFLSELKRPVRTSDYRKL